MNGHIVVHTLAWLVGMWVSIELIFMFIGAELAVRLFPEGWRWWLKPAQYGSLMLFAVVVYFSPF